MEGSTKFLKLAFCSVVFALALFQFSENTADPDLWGHILFGQQHLESGVLPKAEPYSWTAPGHPWINHEVLAEAALGAAHFQAGGNGVLLLKILIGLLTFFLALRIGLQGLTGSERTVAWILGAIAVVQISYGFAARPQIFTALGLAVLLWLLRQVHAGKTNWAWGLPLLFIAWINTHGGALAGIALMWLAAGATTFQFLVVRKKILTGWLEETVTARVLCFLWIATVLSTGALFLNPWGDGLVKWLVGSVLWLRPEIEEWNPAKLSWEHGTFFITALITAISFLFSKRNRSLWEIAFCAALMVLAFRSVRHTPLFCIAAMALVPRHLANVVTRIGFFADRMEMLKKTGMQKALAVLFLILTGAILAGTVRLHKENPLTIEVPRKMYPVAAVKFMQKHELKGNLIVFFDWGEMALWELPECPPSIDGRLDTCYPRELITEHWKLYNGTIPDPRILNLSQADLALLPAGLEGSFSLREAGWKPVYVDDLAVVLVRDEKRFPHLAKLEKPIVADEGATLGRAPFPEQNPRSSVK